MTKEKTIKLLLGISIFLIALFVIMTIRDYSMYNESYSAPFYVSILLRSVEFIIPSIMLLMITYILKNRSKKK